MTKIRICPKCESTNITSFTGVLHIGGADNMSYYCKDCNYGYPSGGMIPKIDSAEGENFRMELKGSEFES